MVDVMLAVGLPSFSKIWFEQPVESIANVRLTWQHCPALPGSNLRLCASLCNVVCVQSIASFLGPHLNTEHPPQSADSSAISTSCDHPANKVANKDVDGHFSRICQCPGGVYVMIKAQCQVVSNCEN